MSAERGSAPSQWYDALLYCVKGAFFGQLIEAESEKDRGFTFSDTASSCHDQIIENGREFEAVVAESHDVSDNSYRAKLQSPGCAGSG
jgi:hypothetical protein